jgi:predicted TIM-barrel fold metal-dependent hydrolase
MDENAVSRALIVCADIGPDENRPNHIFAQQARRAFPGRFELVAELDSFWAPHHHKPGALDRLHRALNDAPDAVGITHYATGPNDGWFRTGEARDVFEQLADRRMLASIAVPPNWLDDLYELAAAVPGVSILLHHCGGFALGPHVRDDLATVCRGASLPNVVVKASGFYYVESSRPWDFPFRDVHENFCTILNAYGADRLAWGSDFPASIGRVTYRQSIEMVAAAAPDLNDASRHAIFGGTMARLLSHVRRA